MVKLGWAVGAASLGVALLAAGPARADVIDGNWCAKDGRTMSIRRPADRHAGWNRHDGRMAPPQFCLRGPAGEAGAGSRIDMLLLNENTVRLTKGGTPEIWHRCDVTS